MRTLLRFAVREMIAAKWKLAVLALIFSAQTAALAGGSLAFDSLFHTRDHYYEQLHFADLRFRFRAATADEMPSLEQLRSIPGVAGVARRFDALAYTERVPTRRPLPLVVHYLDPERRPEVDDLEILAGGFLRADDPDGVVIERSFAAAHGMSLGDEIVIDPHTFPRQVRVIGVGLSPEYLMPTANPEVLIPNRGSLGVVFASSRKLGQLFDEPLYNELAFRFRPGVDRIQIRQELTHALRGLEIERVMPLESNFGFRYVENVLGGSRIFMPMTALLLAAMAAIVAVVVVARLISDRRREIGALKAQGYSVPSLVAALLLFGIVPALAGGLAGVPSAMLFARGLAETNASIAGLPAPMMIYPLGRLGSALAAAGCVGGAAVFIASMIALRGSPARMLRSDGGVSRAPKRFAGWLASLANSTGFRYAARNVSRRVGLSASVILLVALAVAMPAGMLTAMSSWDIWARVTADSLPWDAGVSFKVPLTEAAARERLDLKGIREVEPWLQGYATLARAAEPAREMRVIGVPVPTRLQQVEPARGRGFRAADAAEIIFNTSFLRGAAPPALGEVVSLTFRDRVERLTVVGLLSDASIATVFVPNGTAQRLFDQPDRSTGAYVAFEAAPPAGEAGGTGAPELAAHREIEAAILDRDAVGAVQLKQDIERAMIVYLHGFNAVVAPFVVLSGLLGFLFLLSVLSLLVAERGVEYATLRSMGYGSRELRGMLLTELGILVAAGLAASIVAWFQLAAALRDLMAHAWFWIPVSLRAVDYAWVALPVLLFLLAAAIPVTRQLLRANLSSVLRAQSLQ